MTKKILSSSFRDPMGYVYEEDGVIYRKLTAEAQEVLSQFMGSSLYGRLVDNNAIVSFYWIGDRLRPDIIPFISYPYEWSFSMLKDAALLTLDTELFALEYGMQLKDASAYNVQFIKGHPILIDHLSFHPYEEGKPWVAYRQFCSYFLAPLALAAYRNEDHIRDLQIWLDGLKIGYAAQLLPFKTNFSFGLSAHLKFHGLGGMHRGQTLIREPRLSKTALKGVLRHLKKTVERLNWDPSYGWKDYQKECNYSDKSTHKKGELVENYLKLVEAKNVVDLGCNVGLYSQIASDIGCKVIAIDSDPACVELMYRSNGKGDDILPLVVDITNPSPAIGWENTERDSFLSRLKVDTAMCLALVHHLAIGNNLPLDRIATFLSSICKNLLIEWVPKGDSQVQRMLRHRDDIFDRYTEGDFTDAFEKRFTIRHHDQIEGTARSLYLMEAK